MATSIYSPNVMGLGSLIYISKLRTENLVKPKVLVLSSSDTHGGWIEPGVGLHRYSPTPVEMIAAASGLVYYDETINGWQLKEVLTGGSVAFGTFDPGQPTTSQSLTTLLAAHPDARYVFIGNGMVDILFGGRTTAQVIADMETALGQIHSAGRTAIVRGYNNFAVTSAIDSTQIALNTTTNNALKARMATLGISFVDVHDGVPFYGISDITVDGVHPTMAYHQRICLYEGQQILNITRS